MSENNASDSSVHSIKMIGISDTHSFHRNMDVPTGDILIHCGDFGKYLEHKDELIEFNEWLGTLPHPFKVVVGGNHDILLNDLKPEETQQILSNAIYLQDSGREIMGLKFWGSPWNGSRNMGFSSKGRAEYWNKIPLDTDVLVTHMPPYKILDLAGDGRHWGCQELRHKLDTDLKPKYHLFGHVHEAYGYVDFKGTMFVNCATLNGSHKEFIGKYHLRSPLQIDYQKKTVNSSTPDVIVKTKPTKSS
eukprot:TRINITY_DN2526_c0_g1_i1.p1 TRINITY_DN2526_c0_g1~~TRINITY_DN2526_c0_g1_i1.p1  ORF type:complete len:258 (-),score=66.66 TRINITY_DN2526_c0_g1_i1:204-944(-)